jgi:hypothetical protein
MLPPMLTAEILAAYDKALKASFSIPSYTKYWFDKDGMHAEPVDIRKLHNPRARPLIDAVVSLILH